jgi:lipopolysaccharide biosynthesis regulator YciM
MELLFLLLPVAAASGWWLARREGPGRRAPPPGAAPAFFRGLNYLLDEQPDKAIDCFLELAQVDGETVETHLALGSLFRRRGEVDRAIRIHQNLIARDNLSPEQRGFALFELGQDYMRAGLFDRAELLFQEVVELGMHRERALRGLLDIYQQERDWVKCLEVAERLKPLSERTLVTEIAQYRCELAEEARRQGEAGVARRHLAAAQGADPDCVRATMLEGRIALEEGRHESAAGLLLGVAERGGPFASEVLPELLDTLSALGRDEVPVLQSLAERHPSTQLTLALSEAVRRRQGPAAAMEVLAGYLAGHADLAALDRLLGLKAAEVQDGDTGPQGAIREVVRHLLARQPAYKCEHCGFAARTLHWQCPSCKRWATVQPLQPERILGPEPPKGPRIA